ncbi:MAG: vWA domain-containing protein [Pseudomonadota bacterium]
MSPNLLKNAIAACFISCAVAPALASPLPLVVAHPAAVAVAASPNAKAASIELVFVLDTTGSMGGLLEGAKTKIWSIVNDIMQTQGQKAASVKVGLVAYRDRGDAYVTQVTALSDNLDDVYTRLMELKAEGGGDGPEDVRSAMRDGLKSVQWSKPGPRTSQILFLVGDAPPHDDYQDVPDILETARQARQQGMTVNAIQCGSNGDTTGPWKSLAQFGGGEYFAIAQNGGVQAIATPYDAELASLGEKIGGTYLAYGATTARMASQAKQASMEMRVSAAAPVAAQADRALNKAINTRAYDESDLVQKVESGALNLASVKEAELPEALRALKPEQRQAKLEATSAERKVLRERILALSKKREQFLAAEKKKAGAAKGGFDAAVSSALAKQIK